MENRLRKRVGGLVSGLGPEERDLLLVSDERPNDPGSDEIGHV